MIPGGNHKEQMQQLVNTISTHALSLYDLMEPGMTIEVTFPEPEAILIPNRPPKLRRLLITKPVMHIDIKLAPSAGPRI